MDATEIARLCEDLPLEEEDGAIHEISEDIQQEGFGEVYHCLVGKILSGKKVNRDAFRGFIEHLWNPFGGVEIEVVGDNVFMFYFKNLEDRDRVWQRGPWHFDKCLIVLEKPEGVGDIKKLKFNKAEFWVQIHDIPIMCMNRRTAKWLAEQIGEVLDLPIDSKECRGKFLKVKVRIDISRPLKRWLRLKLDSSENIVVVGLKYERLLEFCYVCGRVGHNSRDCPDEDARLEAMKASSTKYGAWLRATNPERSFFRNSQQDSGNSSGRSKSLEGSREMEEERSLTSRSRPPVGPITPPNRSYPSTFKISSNSCSCRLSISMASSSTPPSTVTLTKKYDVFLSFRGPDTRVGFTSHLHDALSRKCMVTFIDCKLERGDEISPALLKSIQESMIAVVIFSKEYASSKWCLSELAEIMKCKKLHGLIVLPVFYDINPSDVRHQTGPFNDSFAEHENESQEEVQEWREAFTEASNLSGWDYAGTRSEAELVRIIVEDVHRKLMSIYISPLSDFEGLIGMHKRIEQVMPLLCLGTMDVRSIGIWGMGGSGKTTLAEALFNQISGQFDGSCFIEEVEERLENRKSNCLRLEVLSKVLHEVNLELATPTFLHPFIKQRLTQKKVLIVFDGVNKFWQPLETLINDLNRCDSGSRIIIISRDKNVLYNYKVPDCNIYDVEGFNLITAKQENVTLIELFTPEQVREHIRGLRQWVGQSKAKAEKNQAMEHAMSENSCSLCAVDMLNFEPPPIYCTQCGPRIKRNAMYYTMGSGATQPYFCISCYNEARGETIVVDGTAIPKARLEKKKNDEEIEEWWVQCYICEAWQHQICALFNGRKKDGDAQYTCPNCYIEEVERGERKPLPQSAVLGAKDLPRTILSDHIEQRLFKRLKQERLERARFQGKSYDEVLGVESLVIRVVSSVDKKLEVKQQFLEIFQEENYPTEFPYKSKVVLLFQKIEGVEVCLFGMYVQEFGSECQFPNQRRVYLSYLDSVKYFRPEIKVVTGEALSTFVYHEILIGYLEYCKLRGFTSCYIWACPPPKGEDYILYCHPEIQKTPKSDKLREWYLCMLRKAAGENIVVDHTNLYDHFFVPTGESRAKVTAARLPYFDGDYWPVAAEDLIYQIRQEEDGKKQNKKGLTKKTITKRALKASGQTDLSGNASKDLLLMHKLGETIYPMKEDFIMVHLRHACTHCCILMVSGTCHVCRKCKNFQLCDKCFEAEKKRGDRDRHPINLRKVHPLEEVSITDVPADTKDRDEILESEFFDTRLAFLSLCRANYYQYDTLRRAKHSSMMVLYHLHNPTAPAFVTSCIICHLDIETGQGWRCDVCQNYDVCNTCYQKDGGIDHPHKLTNHPSNADRDAQNKEARQLRVVQLRKMLDLLVHASQCRSPHCQYPNCRKVKGLYRHGIQCKTRASGGCVLCKKMWYLLQLHARACKESECPVPRCRDLQEHMRGLQQQSDSRRRAAVMEMMRQRAAEVAGNAAEATGGDRKRRRHNGGTVARG